jgi:Flp pilus assembly protein TadB
VIERGPKPTLDYSSHAEEKRREQAAADERRESVENYNESTFGERRPIASVFLRVAIILAIAAVLFWLLPRRTARLIAILLIIAFAVWDARKGR